ncbi:hypothetical protein [Leifsonia sp. P73]|uniref:hypothetical protein n=1 Tax=Leifsonia sp. P73 TaxID=3423959 RepID=UPI003DA35D82
MTYARADVMLSGLSPANSHSVLPVFQPSYDHCGVGDLIGKVRTRHGEQNISLGIVGVRPGAGLEMRREMHSLRATTHRAELATAHAV